MNLCERCEQDDGTLREYVLDFGDGVRRDYTLCSGCLSQYQHLAHHFSDMRNDDEDEDEDDEDEDDEEVGDPCEPVLVFVVEDAGDPK